MVNIRGQHQRTPSDSPRVEVGEIDTRAPFQSVRAAVTLFGTIKSKASFPSFKRQSSTASSTSESAKNNPSVSDKETRLMLATKDLTKYKKDIETAEATKAQALQELEQARHELEELNSKIMSIKETKHMAVEAAEDLRDHALSLQDEIGREDITADGPWREEIDLALHRHNAVAGELYSSRQALSKLRQDFEAASSARRRAMERALEAQRASDALTKKAGELRREIAAMGESAELSRTEAQRSKKVQAKIVAERESILQSYKPAKEEADRKLEALRSEFNPEMTRILEQQYAEASAEIQDIKEQMRAVQESRSAMSSMRDLHDELYKASEALTSLSSEEAELRASVASARAELESVQRERAEAEDKEQTMIELAASLQEQLQGSKAELESLAELHTDELFSKLHRLLSGINNDKRAVEEINKNVEDIRKETEFTKTEHQESEDHLHEALSELEEAQAGARQASDNLQNASTVCAADFGTGTAAPRIRMSRRDYENLNRKHEEADNIAEMKVAAAVFRMEAINEKAREAEMQVETTLKEIERMQAVIEFALKQAEASERARKEIEAELETWRK